MSRRGRHHEEPPPGYTEQGSLLVPHALGDVDDEPREDSRVTTGARRPTGRRPRAPIRRDPPAPSSSRGRPRACPASAGPGGCPAHDGVRRPALPARGSDGRWLRPSRADDGSAGLGMAETNWKGAQLSDFLWALHPGGRGRRGPACPGRCSYGRDRQGRVSGRAGDGHRLRLGKQQSLLGLLGGEPVPYSPCRERDRTWSAARALIVSAGVFDGLPPDPVAPSDLIQWGLLPELVGRLGEVLRLEPPGRAAVEEILWRSLGPVGAMWEGFGLELVIAQETVGAVAALAMRLRRAARPSLGRPGAPQRR